MSELKLRALNKSFLKRTTEEPARVNVNNIRNTCNKLSTPHLICSFWRKLSLGFETRLLLEFFPEVEVEEIGSFIK